MNILLVGKNSHFMRLLVEKLNKEGHRIFLLTVRNYVTILSVSIKGKLIYRRDDLMRKRYEKLTILVDRNLADGDRL